MSSYDQLILENQRVAVKSTGWLADAFPAWRASADPTSQLGLPGAGSHLFVQVDTAATRPAQPNPDRRASGQRILLIDDSVDAALTLAMLLTFTGYDVQTCNSGRAGLDAGEQWQPAAVILDIGMPDLDGYQTATLMRRQPWGAATILIALTGYGLPDDLRRTQAAGFNAHVVKPVDIDTLAGVLTTLLSRPPSI